MEQVEKSAYIKIKNALTYVGKLLSTAVLILLIIIGMFLIYYVIAARIVVKNPEYRPLFSLYNIATGSMEPNIKVDDVIVNIRVKSPESIKVGDVITFNSTSSISKGLTVTHRVINIIKNDDGTYTLSDDTDTTLDFELKDNTLRLQYTEMSMVMIFEQK